MNIKFSTEDTIRKGLAFLEKSQLSDGSFFSLTSSNPENLKKYKICHSLFSTSLILSCLNNLSENKYPQIISIKKRAANFLLSQKNDYWTFNYWNRHSEDAQKMPYPDDLDDTFCSLSALYQYNPDLINGEVLAKSVKILTTLETKEGGPYKTWLVPQNADNVWKDVDLVVNNNIAYFLSLQEVSLPSLLKLTEDSIVNKKYESPYYPSPYPAIYFISRWYRGKHRKSLLNQINDKLNKSENLNILDIALLSLAKLNLGENKEIDTLKINQILIKNKIGDHWPALPFYVGINPNGDDKKYYAGSPALTTAFCLELLHRINDFQKNDNPNNKDASELRNVENQVSMNIKNHFLCFNSGLRKIALSYLKNIIKKNRNWQIASLPYIFHLSINKNKLKIPIESIISLGTANAYGWIAYTIYDKILDNDDGSDLLPIANFCLRELTLSYKDAFEKLNISPKYFQIFKNIMADIDNANYWEIKNCRVKIKNGKITINNSIHNNHKNNFANITNRSIGHAIGPVTLLLAQKYKPNSKEVKYTLDFFRHYIIARQLNDDAHDWEDDFKKGIITKTGGLILKKLKTKTIDLNSDLPKIKKIFWKNIFPDACNEILNHLNKAKEYLNKNQAIENKSLLIALLNPVESAAISALKEHEKTSLFLKEFK